MAYDRYETRHGRFSDHDRERGYDRGRDDDRGFIERAGDEISSWFGDDDSDRRRPEDERMNRGRDFGRAHAHNRGSTRDRDDRYVYGDWGGDPDRERFSSRSSGRDRDDDYERSYRPMNWTSSNRDYRTGYGREDRDLGAGAGAFGSGADFGRSGPDRGGYDRSETPWGRDDYRRTSFAGAGHDTDRHYHSLRQQQLDELDRDYDEFRSENRQRFESEFGSWRQNRQQKRGLLNRIQEHMDVVGSDGETIGKVDKVRGDHVILTKDDSDDNRHHSIKCTRIDTVEGNQVRLDVPAEEAKSRWRDEDDRGFFGRDDEEEHVTLERSFAGTYR